MDVALLIKWVMGIALAVGVIGSLLWGEFGDSGMMNSRAAKLSRDFLCKERVKIQESIERVELYPNFLGRADLIAKGKRLSNECESLERCAKLPEQAFADVLQRVDAFHAGVDRALEAQIDRWFGPSPQGSRSLRE